MVKGVKRIGYPFLEKDVRMLKAGDAVLVSGRVFTGRDRFHKHFADGGRLPVDFRDGALFHCGPVVIKDEQGNWKVVAAGPTTSIREEPYQGDIIKQFGLRAVIGKGGMGEKTLAACKEFGCVYFHAIGGAAQVLASNIKKVKDVHFMEKFGSPEAMWELEVVKFPVVVTMDSHGRSLHKEVLENSTKVFNQLVK